MLKYWIWLSEALEYGSMHFKTLLERYNNPQVIFRTPVKELEATYLLNPNEIKRLSWKSLDKSLKIIDLCKKSGITIIPYDDERYPATLKEIPNPPVCLYVKGTMPDFSKIPVVTIVGARKVSEYGRMVAWSLAGRLAAGGICILSGGALGVDCASHEGCMAVGGKTVAIIPCGLNYDYLKTNAFLRKMICDSGCLISELPPDEPLHKNAFQLRNRLMSGMSLGVVIVEAAEKSGTMITARHAVEQGRDVFVVTGRAGDKNYAGSNSLIRDGAKPVFSAEDIFLEYINNYPNIIDIEKAKKTNLNKIYSIFNSPKNIRTEDPKQVSTPETKESNKKIKKKIDETLPKTLQIVYNYVDKDIFLADDLLSCGLPLDEILSALTQLEIYGYIKAIPGARYEVIY